MAERRETLLIIFAVLAAGILLISNLVATKLWEFCGIAVDGGIILFPFSYVLGDVIVEIFGRKKANRIVWTSLGLNVLAVGVFMIVGALPPYPGWEGQDAYMQILGFVPRIVTASLVAYVASQLLNNLVFEKIKQKTGKKWLGLRAIVSSVLGRAVDSAIFETIAFIGVLSFGEFIGQATFAYFAGMTLEVLLIPITYLAVGGARKWLSSKSKHD